MCSGPRIWPAWPGYSPYEGFAIRGGIHQVWLRGRLAVEDGFVLAGPDGKYIPRGKCSL